MGDDTVKLDRVGLWRSIRRTRRRDLVGPTTGGALLLGVGGGATLLARTEVPDRVEVAADCLFVLAPLLGLLFAAFAMVMALFTDNFVRWLHANDVEGYRGVTSILEPFLAAIGLQVGTILLCICYRASASLVAHWVEGTAWLLLCFLLVFVLLDVVSLGRAMLFLGIARAHEVEERRAGVPFTDRSDEASSRDQERPNRG